MSTNSDYLMSLEAFQKKLNKKPNANNVLEMSGFKYVSIDYCQNKLNEVFFGQWKTENFRWQVVANEIIGSVDLHVFHPVSETWLVRTGAAANIIRQDAGAQLTDVNAKKKNALEQDFPKLMSECIKAACKQLGRLFGQDLNRKDASLGTYESTVTDVYNGYKARISAATTVAELDVIAAERGAIVMAGIMDLIKIREAQLCLK
jgi:hypothetical protein